MDGCVGQQHIDRDVNVNGRRGSLIPRSSQNLETAGPSDQIGARQSFSSNEIREDSVAINNQNRRYSYPSNADSGPSTSQERMPHNLDSSNKRHEISKNSNHNYGKSFADLPINDGSMAAFRDMTTGNLGKQRERQLEVLRRMEERIRHMSKNNSQPRREITSPPVTSTIKLLPPKMAMFVMDISSVLTEHFVSWLPLKSVPEGSPEDTILYTLVVGNGELIMFGGIQKDATSVTQQTQSSLNIANTVSNSLHFITAPFDII